MSITDATPGQDKISYIVHELMQNIEFLRDLDNLHPQDNINSAMQFPKKVVDLANKYSLDTSTIISLLSSGVESVNGPLKYSFNDICKIQNTYKDELKVDSGTISESVSGEVLSKYLNYPVGILVSSRASQTDIIRYIKAHWNEIEDIQIEGQSVTQKQKAKRKSETLLRDVILRSRSVLRHTKGKIYTVEFVNLCFIAKATKTAESIILLSKHGQSEDALVLCRTILEISFMQALINLDFDKCIPVFGKHDRRKYQEDYESFKKWVKTSGDDEQVNKVAQTLLQIRLENKEKLAEEKYDPKKPWFESLGFSSLGQIAKHLDAHYSDGGQAYGHMYNGPYSFYSRYVHTAAYSLNNFFEADEYGQFIVKPNGKGDRYYPILFAANDCINILRNCRYILQHTTPVDELSGAVRVLMDQYTLISES